MSRVVPYGLAATPPSPRSPGHVPAGVLPELGVSSFPLLGSQA
jgi:hypothetical protein